MSADRDRGGALVAHQVQANARLADLCGARNRRQVELQQPGICSSQPDPIAVAHRLHVVAADERVIGRVQHGDRHGAAREGGRAGKHRE